jgi:D-alanyl-D-alanine carboxypeptidase
MNRDNRRVVAVVLGGKTGASRDQRMASLLGDYFNKASTGGKTAPPVLPLEVDEPLVASAAIPVPRARPDSDGDIAIETGSVAVAAVIIDESNGEGDVDVDEADAAPPPPPARAAVTSKRIAGGWKIQIAATPTQAAALDMLARAQAKAPIVLGDVAPHTETVVKGETTLYRARFVGFADKKSANAACAYLTKREFACLAIAE